MPLFNFNKQGVYSIGTPPSSRVNLVSGHGGRKTSCSMQLGEQASGQLFMAGMPGTRLDKGTETLIREYNLGGVILFAKNIQDPFQITSLCKDIQEKALAHQGLPLFIAVDQEGGRVKRLPAPFTCFPGNEEIGRDEAPVARAEEFALTTAREMSLVGLNMNMAPVVDVRRGESPDYLAGRTFSNDPEQVSLLGRTVVRLFQKNGVMAVGKHFPGLGRGHIDPHCRLPTVATGLEELYRTDIPPFRAIIEEGVSGIMTSHAVYPALDPSGPATVSPKILTDILRRELGFQGLIITDDLEMGAIANQMDISEGAVGSFEAGADILLVCSRQEGVLQAMGALQEASSGKVGRARLMRSLERIRNLKARFLKRAAGETPWEEVRKYFRAPGRPNA